jgi:hypothetical protein
MAGTGAPGGHGPTVDSKAQFLAAVEEMAMNALATVAAYNAEIKDGVSLNKMNNLKPQQIKEKINKSCQ